MSGAADPVHAAAATGSGRVQHPLVVQGAPGVGLVHVGAERPGARALVEADRLGQAVDAVTGASARGRPLEGTQVRSGESVGASRPEGEGAPMRRRAGTPAALIALLAALTSCADDQPAGQDGEAASTTPSSTDTSSSTPPRTAASSAVPTPETSSPAGSLDACELLDVPSLEAAGLQVDDPVGELLRATDGPDVAAALRGRDALATCDAGFAASAQINDMPDEQSARAEAETALSTAANTPTAVRSELVGASVPFGATVVDPEYTSASVQFQLRDLHVAVVIGYADAGGLSVADVQALLDVQLDTALTALG